MLHILSWMGFIIYLFMMVYFFFFSEQLGRTPSRTYHYNLVPLAEIKRYLNYIDTIGFLYVMLNLAGNVICFMPLGLLYPILSNHRWGFFRDHLDQCIGIALRGTGTARIKAWFL